MKVEFTYEVVVIVDEEKGAEVEAAIKKAVEAFDPIAGVDETDAQEIPDDEE